MKYQVSFCAKTYLHTLFSHVKRSPSLWLHNKSRLSQQNNIYEMVWHFIGVYIINRTSHGHLKIRNFSSSVEKYFTSEPLYIPVVLSFELI